MILEHISLVFAVLLLWELMGIPSPLDYYLKKKNRHSLVKLLDKEGADLEYVPGTFLPSELDEEISKRKKIAKLRNNCKIKFSEVAES